MSVIVPTVVFVDSISRSNGLWECVADTIGLSVLLEFSDGGDVNGDSPWWELYQDR